MWFTGCSFLWIRFFPYKFTTKEVFLSNCIFHKISVMQSPTNQTIYKVKYKHALPVWLLLFTDLCDIHMSLTYVINPCDWSMWFTYVNDMGGCDLPMWMIWVVDLCDWSMWFTYVIDLCGWPVINLCEWPVWFTYVIDQCDLPMWLTHVIDQCDWPCDLPMWLSGVIYLCDWPMWLTMFQRALCRGCSRDLSSCCHSFSLPM